MHLHLSSFIWNASQTTSWSGLSDPFYIRLECVSEGIYTWSFHNRIAIQSKYDRIQIGYAQKLDLSWQSERGWTENHWSNRASVNVQILYLRMASNKNCLHIQILAELWLYHKEKCIHLIIPWCGTKHLSSVIWMLVCILVYAHSKIKSVYMHIL